MEQKRRIRLLYYPGGKGHITKNIISAFPKNYEDLAYVEVFGGTGKVLFNKLPSKKFEVYNDLNFFLYAIFKVITNDKLKIKFFEKIYLTPVHRIVFEESCKIIDDIKQNPEKYKLFDIAYWTYVNAMLSFNGVGSSFSTSVGVNSRLPRGYMLKHRIPEYIDRFISVFIECKDYKELLEKYNDEHILIYADPPYIYGIKYNTFIRYSNLPPFTMEDHITLSNLLRKHSGYVCLSLDYCDETKELYKEFYYNIIKNLSGSNRRVLKTADLVYLPEAIITNYPHEDYYSFEEVGAIEHGRI